MKTVKSRLLATSLLSGVMAAFGLTPGLAAAQDDTRVEELVVTGSRIPRANIDQPTPVSTISQQLIQNAGTQNLGDVIAQLPALSSSGSVRGNGNSFGDLGGLNFPNLRDLGTARTLTLVDGKRHVAGDAGDSAVDLNAIPPALVSRVEVITGGASAIYGSDAVSGVINIITKRDFEGVEFQVEGGQPWRGDYGRNTSAWVTLGKNLDNDKANLTFSAFWDQTKGVRASDIKSLNNYGSIVNSAPFDGQPDRILRPRVISEYIDENTVLLDSSFSPLTGFTTNGVPVPQPLRTGDNSFAFGSFDADCATCFNLEDWLLLSPPTRRAGLATTFRYDFTPNFGFFFDGKFVQTKVHDYVQPSFYFGDFQLAPDNAFITPAIEAVLDTTPDGVAFISRFNGDIGGRTNNITRETYRVVTGFEGKVDPGFAEVSWELSFNKAQTKNVILSAGASIPGNYAAALDAVRDPATGQIRCRIDVPALQGPDYAAPGGTTSETCIPYNPFGQQNSAAAIDYVSHQSARVHRIDQEVVTGTLNFDTERFFSLPGGPIGFAGGFEYRKERSENLNDPFIKSGLSDTAAQPDASGGFHVWEGFAETRLPLLRDLPFAEELTLEGAIRYADYSTVGSATAWKVGGTWAPVQDVKFRGTYSKAVRAPNITEAFLPPTSAFFDVNDPCDDDEINTDPDRAANCAALGVPAGFNAIDNAGVEGAASGNANLDSERSKSWTVGVVLQPRWTPGLTLTVDYFNIKIKDAITFVDEQDIVDNCVDASGGPDESFCSLFTRDATGNINFLESTYLNASALETNGWDINLTYARDVDFWKMNGRFTGSVTATHLDKFRLFAFQNRPDEVDIEEGTRNNPEWKVLATLNYAQGPVEVGWKSRFLSRTVRYSRDPQQDGAEAISPSQIEPVWYHDVIVRLTTRRWGEGMTFYAGVNNVFDEEMPLGVVQGDGTDASYDLLGRYAFVGVRARF